MAMACFHVIFSMFAGNKTSTIPTRHTSKANFDEKNQLTPAARKLSEIMDKKIPKQKNFSARNQKRFLKNQLKHQSLISLFPMFNNETISVPTYFFSTPQKKALLLFPM